MGNRTPSPRHDVIRVLAGNPEISTRAVAFLAGLLPLVAERSKGGKRLAYISRREVELATGMDHKSWPLAEVEALGVTYLPPEAGGVVHTSSGLVGDAGAWGVQFAPIGVFTTSTTSTTSTRGQGGQYHATYGGELHPPGPTDLAWKPLGRYGLDWWRWTVLVGMVDVPVTRALLSERLGLSADQAKRAMRAAKAYRLVSAEGTYRGSWLGDSGMFASGRDDWDRAKAHLTERQAFLDARTPAKVEEPPAAQPEPVVVKDRWGWPVSVG